MYNISYHIYTENIDLHIYSTYSLDTLLSFHCALLCVCVSEYISLSVCVNVCACVHRLAAATLAPTPLINMYVF